ncbi:MAG: 23S rRNA (guanosine(2251)-2'-O)-methyltransferase RlmB [Synergistales bacterium]|jgi:23S rRNA (guanosine2251-2'-O)-methyltransferase|nr:23S rRNA (guanosine(2251)-2'-O)-methyltransferase RlmB [Synergistales bacterium]
MSAKKEEKKLLPKGEEDYCWGRHPVLTLLEESPQRCLKLYVMKGSGGEAVEKALDICKGRSIPFQIVDAAVIKRLCGGENHQGLLAQISAVALEPLENYLERIPLSGPTLLLALDHIQDPQNLGSMIRSAEAAGAEAVLIPLRRSALPTGAVMKVSAGAALRLPLLSVGNLSQTLQLLAERHHFWIVGLDHRAERTLWEEPLPDRCVLVVGSEGRGLSPLVAKRCDDRRCIPMCGKTGSLNASVAASIGLFEWLRCVDKCSEGL